MSTRAVVIGAGVAGILAAAALSPAVDEVLVLDRDDLPDGPEHRRGLPQGRHAHLLMAGGLAAADALLPGLDLRRHLLAAGAREVSLGTGMVTLTSEGWFRRWRPETPRMITCSRALLDWAVRTAVLARTGNVTVRRAEALELAGTAQRVTGVRVAADGAEDTLPADLVVDAGGRGSRIMRWLERLGVTGVRERSVDSGLVNATRVYRVPPGAEGFPLTIVNANPFLSRPGRSGMVLPIEDDRWMVSLAGTRGGEPPADPDGFLRYALDLPHPIVGRLVSGAEPLTGVHVTRSTRNVRRHLEKAPAWPEGLVVLGYAFATYNPAYGQGMSVAALGARVLAEELRRTGPHGPGLARRVLRGAARPVEAAWTMAVSQDLWYPGVRGGRPGLTDRLATQYVRRLTRAATGSFTAASALWEVTSMQAGAERLFRPGAVLSALTGPPLPPLSGPPLTAQEWKILRELDRTGAED
jgi:2-polyprenyl-6-methoxyphenol hydroxylase-like FAD-dependent oxidoreductase